MLNRLSGVDIRDDNPRFGGVHLPLSQHKTPQVAYAESTIDNESGCQTIDRYLRGILRQACVYEVPAERLRRHYAL